MSWFGKFLAIFKSKPPKPPSVYRWDLGLTVVPPTAAANLEIGQRLFVGTVDGAGHRTFHLSSPPEVRNWPGTLHVSAEGYRTAVVQLPNVGDVSHEEALIANPVVLELNTPPVERLIPDGSFFRTEGGRRVFVVGNNDHQMFERWVNDRPKFETVFAQRRSIFVPEPQYPMLLRVASMCNVRNQDGSITPAVLKFDADYYAAWRPFLRRLAQDGFHCEIIAFIGTQFLMPDSEQRVRHWTSLLDAVRGEPNVMIERVNEQSIASNAIDLPRFPMPTDILCAAGSNGSQEEPVRPWGRYETGHFNDAPEWWRKVGHNGMEFSEGADPAPIASRVPFCGNEITRCPDRDANPNHYFDAAQVASLLIARIDFHSDNGRFGELFGTQEEDCARALVAGAKSISPECQPGGYRHPTELEGPDDLRVYQRGTAVECIARARK